MAHRIVIERADGGVSIMQLADLMFAQVGFRVLARLCDNSEGRALIVAAAPSMIDDVALRTVAGMPDAAPRDAIAAKAAIIHEMLAERPEFVGAGTWIRKAIDGLPAKLAAAEGAEAIADELRHAIAADVDRWQVSAGTRALGWHEADTADLPVGQRGYREAWHHAGAGKVAVHMGRARAIHLARLRKARAPALDALDIEYQRADEKGDAAGKAAIAKRKQALRDLPALLKLEQHATPEALAAAWPKDLPQPD